MTKNLVSRLAAFAAGLLVSASAFAAGGGNLQQSGTDLDDQASLQRGAALYMNYCGGCHSLKYLRYARIAEDLGLSEEDVQTHLNFTGGKIGDHIISPMSAEMGLAAFGKAPPDLSVISRVRGNDWVYTYLKSFYLDESRPLGWNNTVFPNASMPNPLWQMQGLQHPQFGTPDATGERPVTGLVVTQPGRMQGAEFDQVVRDISAFLAYTGEPAGLKRQNLGVWVLLFLAFFTFLAWLMKREYWKDVH